MLIIAIWGALLHRCPPKFIGTLGECCRMSLPWVKPMGELNVDARRIAALSSGHDLSHLAYHRLRDWLVGRLRRSPQTT